MARKIDDDILIELHKSGTPQKEIARHFGVSPAAVCKRLRRLTEDPLPESFSDLTAKQKRFALSIAEGKSQTAAAVDAFDVGSIASAKAIGHRLMQEPDIQLAITDLLAQEGLPRRTRIQKLAQHVESRDPAISLKALDTSFKLGGEYSAEKVAVVAEIHASEIVERIEELLTQIGDGADVEEIELFSD